MIRAIRRFFLRMEIAHLEARVYEDERAVEMWPQTKAVYLVELSRLKQSLDRLNGRRDPLNWAFTPKEKQ
jgi:hypothetical protein